MRPRIQILVSLINQGERLSLRTESDDVEPLWRVVSDHLLKAALLDPDKVQRQIPRK